MLQSIPDEVRVKERKMMGEEGGGEKAVEIAYLSVLSGLRLGSKTQNEILI